MMRLPAVLLPVNGSGAVLECRIVVFVAISVDPVGRVVGDDGLVDGLVGAVVVVPFPRVVTVPALVVVVTASDVEVAFGMVVVVAPGIEVGTVVVPGGRVVVVAPAVVVGGAAVVGGGVVVVGEVGSRQPLSRIGCPLGQFLPP
jgi:hypothetical protein